MSDDNKTTQPVESKVNTIVKLRGWVKTQLEAIKKTIPSAAQIKEIAAEVADNISLDVSQVKDIVKEVVGEGSPTIHRIFIVNVRWEYPAFGGIPMPPGVCFYGFKTFWYTEIAPGAGVSEAAVKAQAMAMGAGERGLTVESISLLPIGWEIDNKIVPDPSAEAA